MFRPGDTALQNGMAQDGIHILPRNALKRRPSDRKCPTFGVLCFTLGVFCSTLGVLFHFGCAAFHFGCVEFYFHLRSRFSLILRMFCFTYNS